MNPLSTLPPPSDIGTIATSFGIFSLAIAAAVTGLWRGIREIGKGGEKTGSTVASAVLLENVTLHQLTESNRLVSETNKTFTEVIRLLDRNVDRLIESVKESRETTRSSTEEAHRLRVATTDLYELMRSQRR